jgi:hypothetical protein
MDRGAESEQVMTEAQGWFLVVEVGVLAILALVGRFHT